MKVCGNGWIVCCFAQILALVELRVRQLGSHVGNFDALCYLVVYSSFLNTLARYLSLHTRLVLLQGDFGVKLLWVRVITCLHVWRHKHGGIVAVGAFRGLPSCVFDGLQELVPLLAPLYCNYICFTQTPLGCSKLWCFGKLWLFHSWNRWLCNDFFLIRLRKELLWLQRGRLLVLDPDRSILQ